MKVDKILLVISLLNRVAPENPLKVLKNREQNRNKNLTKAFFNNFILSQKSRKFITHQKKVRKIEINRTQVKFLPMIYI